MSNYEWRESGKSSAAIPHHAALHLRILTFDAPRGTIHSQFWNGFSLMSRHSSSEKDHKKELDQFYSSVDKILPTTSQIQRLQALAKMKLWEGSNRSQEPLSGHQLGTERSALRGVSIELQLRFRGIHSWNPCWQMICQGMFQESA